MLSLIKLYVTLIERNYILSGYVYFHYVQCLVVVICKHFFCSVSVLIHSVRTNYVPKYVDDLCTRDDQFRPYRRHNYADPYHFAMVHGRIGGLTMFSDKCAL